MMNLPKASCGGHAAGRPVGGSTHELLSSSRKAVALREEKPALGEDSKP